MAKKGGAGGVILVAIVLGLATAYLIWAYFRKMDEQSRKNWQPVVVARQDIKARTKVTRDMLELTAFPKELIAENSIGKIEQAENRMTARDIRSKEQVRNNDLVQEGMVPTLAYKVPEGMRAIAIGAGEVMSVGTSVQPGDHVDIVATYHDPRTRQELTKMLMQNVLVLAVNRGQTEAGGKEGGAASSMTLAVKPEETELVAAADRQGALRISLRPVNDNKVVSTDGVTTRDFSGARVQEEAPAAPKTQPVFITPPSSSRQRAEVTVIRGTAEQTVSP